jgi:predicted DNA-binding transcriptional regulator AlpA
MDPLLSQKQAARILGVSPRTLERHRVAGTGPRYARLGRLVRYRQCDLVDWVESGLTHSTSEVSEPRVMVRIEHRPSTIDVELDNPVVNIVACKRENSDEQQDQKE